MKFKLFIILLFATIIESPGQVEESQLYQAAYSYLNDSVIKLEYADVKVLAENCNDCCVKGIKLKFDTELQVANKFIKNDRGFPLGDLVEKKYNFSQGCLKAIRMGTRECEISNQVQDSLKTFWTGYEMKDDIEISEFLKEILSDKKDGYQVFFSDIYKNTIAAELKSFCLPYDETIWQGSSTSYFFIFDETGKIEEVYSGISIHYN